MGRVKHVGDSVYRGFDGDVEVVIEPGSSRDVSDEKAVQLVRDFPEEFTAVKKPGRKPAAE